MLARVAERTDAGDEPLRPAALGASRPRTSLRAHERVPEDAAAQLAAAARDRQRFVGVVADVAQYLANAARRVKSRQGIKLGDQRLGVDLLAGDGKPFELRPLPLLRCGTACKRTHCLIADGVDRL